MLTALEQHCMESVTHSLNSISQSLEVLAKNQSITPSQSEEHCMDFDEWAMRLDFEQRRELMKFLWRHPQWHDTCLREEDSDV